MNNLHIAFFTEAGSSRGMGHLVRCQTISERFKTLDIETTFFLDSDVNFDYKFNNINYFKWEEFELKNDYDIIFIDSYEANISIYNKIFRACKLAVYIDDYKRLDYPKGVILNFAPDAKEEFFKDKDGKYKYLLGLKYIPIRDDFLRLQIDKKEQVFIMLGGSDTAKLSLELATILKDITIAKIIVSNNKEIIDSLKQYKNVEVLYKPLDTELIKAMASSIMAISTASMSVYELAYLKIPTIVIAVAKNQEVGMPQLVKFNLAYDFVLIQKNSWKDDMKNKVDSLLSLQTYKVNNQIDGNGASNIVNEVLEMIK